MRLALLDADAALPVVERFLDAVKQKALGMPISHNPGQTFINIVRQEMADIMGGEQAQLILKKSPSVILACGLQGVGKTTNMAKIAKMLKTQNKKRVMLGSVDIRRPAALEQLSILAKSIDVTYADSDEKDDAIVRALDIVKTARRQLVDVILIDTAGRAVLDDEMMDEIRRLYQTLSPPETLFFVDSMQGQDAVNTAREFHKAVNITGIVLTKFDGDSRGGAALSARAITGASIKFVGVGEKMDDIQTFHPTRFASRILGMGDLESLAEQAAKADPAALRATANVLKKPSGFDLNDQLTQLRQMKKMGGIKAMAENMPDSVAEKIKNLDDDAIKIGQLEAIICAMTPQERSHPDIIKASRKRRIAAGAGVKVTKINQLLTQHQQTGKMMKKFAKNPAGLMRMMSGMFN